MLMVYLTFCTILLNFELFSLTSGVQCKNKPKAKEGKEREIWRMEIG